jgi:hypothetical protein
MKTTNNYYIAELNEKHWSNFDPFSRLFYLTYKTIQFVILTLIGRMRREK